MGVGHGSDRDRVATGAPQNARTSRSWQSITNATDTTSPLQRGIWKMSEQNR
jgi:hypothetical protein